MIGVLVLTITLSLYFTTVSSSSMCDSNPVWTFDMSFAEKIENCTLRSDVSDEIAECVMQTLDHSGYNHPQCKQIPEDELASLYFNSTDLMRRHILLSKISGPVSKIMNATYIGIAGAHGRIEHDDFYFVCDMDDYEAYINNYTDENCGWDYTLKDLGSEYFPRYVLMPECHGMWTEEDTVSGVFALKKQMTSCEDDTYEKWLPCAIPTEVNLSCYCHPY